MVTVYDEVTDPQGNIISSTPRLVDNPLFTREEYLDARKAVKAIVANENQPLALRAVARFLLMVSWQAMDNPTDSTEPLPNV